MYIAALASELNEIILTATKPSTTKSNAMFRLFFRIPGKKICSKANYSQLERCKDLKNLTL